MIIKRIAKSEWKYLCSLKAENESLELKIAILEQDLRRVEKELIETEKFVNNQC